MSRVLAAGVVASQFEVTDEALQRCFDAFVSELNISLEQRRDVMPQIPTYITRVAYGTEKGFCLGVDIGGTDFRVCSVELHGDSTYTTRQNVLVVPRTVTVAKDAREIFSFIAGHLKGFLEDEHSDRLAKKELMNLGFCFAFPVDQKTVNSGTLLRWTKGFDIEDAVGKDVCQLLQTEIDELDLPVKVTAIVNDTLGTIIARAFALPVSQTRTSIGAIFGMGTNAAYLEKLSKIKKDIGEHDTGTGAMFLNVEWGSFDNELKVLPKTWYDQQIDEMSVNPGSQMFEKRISSMFLGEILRLAIEKMYDDPKAGLFPNFRRNDKSLLLRNRWSVDMTIMSIAETDMSVELDALRKKIEATFGLPGWAVTKQDAQVVRKISQAIARRAARLSGMAIAAVVHQSGKLDEVDPLTLPASDAMRSNSNGIDESRMVDVAVDGNVYEVYPNFEEYMREALQAIEQVGPEGEERIRIGLTKDGASIGTAIIALLASQQKEHATE